jgi:uncharacterized protein YciW
MAINFGDYGKSRNLDTKPLSDAIARIAENLGTPQSRKAYWEGENKKSWENYKQKEFNALFENTYKDNFSTLEDLKTSALGFSHVDMNTAWSTYKTDAPTGTGKYASSAEYSTAFKEHEASRAANILNQIDLIRMQPGMNKRSIQNALKNTPMMNFLMKNNPEHFMEGGKYQDLVAPETWAEYRQKHGWNEPGGVADFLGFGAQDWAEGSLIGNTGRFALQYGLPAGGVVTALYKLGPGVANWLKGNPAAAKAIENAAKNVPESQRASWLKKTGESIKKWLMSDSIARKTADTSKSILDKAKKINIDTLRPQYGTGQIMKNIGRGGAHFLAPEILGAGVEKITGEEKLGDAAKVGLRASVGSYYLAPMMSAAYKGLQKHGFRKVMKEAVKRFGWKWAAGTVGKLGVAGVGGALSGGILTALMAAWTVSDIVQFAKMIADMGTEEQGNTNMYNKERADLNKISNNPAVMESMSPELKEKYLELQKSYNNTRK